MDNSASNIETLEFPKMPIDKFYLLYRHYTGCKETPSYRHVTIRLDKELSVSLDYEDNGKAGKLKVRIKDSNSLKRRKILDEIVGLLNRDS